MSSALFDSQVILRTDASELGNLIASETLYSAPRHAPKAHVLGPEACPPHPQILPSGESTIHLASFTPSPVTQSV